MTLHISPTIAALIGLPPSLALVLTTGFVVFLFRRDFRERPNVTRALWVPLFWMLIVCSRAVSEWLRTVGVPIGRTSAEEGSPLDACVYFGLIGAGLYILNRRRVNWADVIQRNAWLFAFLAYCFVAIVWSDYPFVAFKRWIKIAGLPVMALVLFTEPDFDEALTRLLKRSAYVLIPFSIVAIKYYPDFGLKYDEWTGLAVYRGLAQSKNMMGCVCLILGLFFFWHFLKTRRLARSRMRRQEFLLTAGFLLMIGWILRTIQSSTSMVCLAVGAAVVAALGMRMVNKKQVGMYILCVIFTLVVAELTFGLSRYVIEFLNKDPTLSDRTRLWSDILNIKFNRIFGVGFESFWLGTRLDRLRETRSFQPNEAHNGYLEAYINLGILGLSMLIIMIIAAYQKLHRQLLNNFEFGRFGLGVLAAIVLYNFTEASFTGPQAMWFVFYVIALNYPVLQFESPLQQFDLAEYNEAESEPNYLEGAV